MITITMTETGATPKIARRELNKLYKKMFMAGAGWWHGRFEKKHFTARGAAQYKYRRRSKKYTAKKQRIFGHTLPLVFTGQSRILASIRDIRGTAKGARAVIHARGLNRRPRNAPGKSMREEMTTVSRSEERSIFRRMEDDLTRSFGRISARSTKRIT